MSPIKPNRRLDSIDVLMLPDDLAVQWLYDHSSTDKSRYVTDEEAHLHKLASFSFARRQSKRLRITVARYGSHIPALRRFLHKGTKTERLAVLSNPLIGPHDKHLLREDLRVISETEALDILKRYRSCSHEFGVFATNPYLNRGWLADIVSQWTEAACYDDGVFLSLIQCLIDNPIICERSDETFLDGFYHHEFNRLNYALVGLLESAPISREWARVLSAMLEKLHLRFVPSFDADVIERWKPSQHDNKASFFCWFMELRQNIVKYLICRDGVPYDQQEYLIKHQDPAVRIGLYRLITPRQLFGRLLDEVDLRYISFRDLDTRPLTDSEQKIVEICKSCFTRDKNSFVESLIYNNAFWTKSEYRELLADLSWYLAEDPNSSMHLPNIYNGIEASHRENYPHFFEDDDYQEYLNSDASNEDLLEERFLAIKESLQDFVNSSTVRLDSKFLQHEEKLNSLDSSINENNVRIQHLSRQIKNDSDYFDNKFEMRLKEIEREINNKVGFLGWVMIASALIILYLFLN